MWQYYSQAFYSLWYFHWDDFHPGLVFLQDRIFIYRLIEDILFNFRMTFVNLKGEVVYNRKEIALNYVSGMSK